LNKINHSPLQSLRWWATTSGAGIPTECSIV